MKREGNSCTNHYKKDGGASNYLKTIGQSEKYGSVLK